MGIFGKIPLRRLPQQLCEMIDFDDMGYVAINSFILKETKENVYIFIDLNSEVYLKEEDIPENNYDEYGRPIVYILFYKKGLGLKHYHFDFDFSDVDPDSFYFNFNTETSIRRLKGDQDYIYYKNPSIYYPKDFNKIDEDIEKDFEIEIYESSKSLNAMEEELEKAVAIEDYELAAKIRDDIAQFYPNNQKGSL